MIGNFTGLALKRVLLFLWAVWLSLVVATNVCDGLKAIAVLPATWSFASGNYRYMVMVTAIHATPRRLVEFLFGAVVFWEAVAALLLWRLLLGFRGQSDSRIAMTFAVNLGLWLAFMIADEIFLAYDVENSHRSLLIAQAATLLVLKLLPD